MTRSPADFGRFTKQEVLMNPFTYSYPVKVYFGEKAAEKNLAAELAKVGPNVLLAYGGGSIKKNGIYGSKPLKDAYEKLYDLYLAEGLIESEIGRLLILDIKEEQYFTARGFTDQHIGGQAFAKDKSIMGWLFGAH